MGGVGVCVCGVGMCVGGVGMCVWVGVCGVGMCVGGVGMCVWVVLLYAEWVWYDKLKPPVSIVNENHFTIN